MFLVADSGSSKTDWTLITKEGKRIGDYSSQGYNPMIVDAEYVYDDMMKNADLRANAEEITHVYFFGAGCSAPHLVEIIAEAIQRIFINANVVVDHDLMACAYAAFDGEPVICAIIGTGSNSCCFDGEHVTSNVPALGFVLGDEASGAYFGKRLLRHFMYKRMDAAMEADFISTYNIDNDIIFNRVYTAKRPNTFLASFMPFIAKHRLHPTIAQWLADGFDDFHATHITDYPINNIKYVGSIGHYFNEELKASCERMGLVYQGVIPKPIDNLADYIYKYRYAVGV